MRVLGKPALDPGLGRHELGRERVRLRLLERTIKRIHSLPRVDPRLVPEPMMAELVGQAEPLARRPVRRVHEDHRRAGATPQVSAGETVRNLYYRDGDPGPLFDD